MTRQEFKQKCIELRKQNFTIKEITQILKRSKTSVYFHVKSIPKSKALLTKIRENNLIHLNRIKPNLKGISWTGRHCRGFSSWTPVLVNLIAHTMFDGELRKTDLIYHNSSVVLINNFKEKMKIIYDHEPKTYTMPNSVIRLAYFSVELANFLREKQEELLDKISTFNKDFQREFLKAFFNDEGCVTFQKKGNKRKIRGYQYNDEILFLVQELLRNFNIESKVDTKFHEIIISRRENLEKFAKEINFSAGVKVNGRRSNSIWKEDLEKREILNRALNSYL